MCELKAQILKSFLGFSIAPHCISWRDNYICIVTHDVIYVMHFILKPIIETQDLVYAVNKIVPNTEGVDLNIGLNTEYVINSSESKSCLSILDRILYQPQHSILQGYYFVRCELSPNINNGRPMVVALTLNHELYLYTWESSNIGKQVFNFTQQYYKIAKRAKFIFDDLGKDRKNDDVYDPEVSSYESIQRNLAFTSMHWCALSTKTSKRTNATPGALMFSVMASGSLIAWLITTHPYKSGLGPSLQKQGDHSTNSNVGNDLKEDELCVEFLTRVDGLEIKLCHVGAVTNICEKNSWPNGEEAGRAVWVLVVLANKSGNLNAALTRVEWNADRLGLSGPPHPRMRSSGVIQLLTLNQQLGSDLAYDAILLEPLQKSATNHELSNLPDGTKSADYVLVAVQQFLITVHVLNVTLLSPTIDTSDLDALKDQARIKLVATVSLKGHNVAPITGIDLAPKGKLKSGFEVTCFLGSQDGMLQKLSFTVTAQTDGENCSVRACVEPVRIKQQWSLAQDSRAKQGGNGAANAENDNFHDFLSTNVSMVEGLTTSSGGTYLATISRPRKFYDHLALKRPIQLSMYQLNDNETTMNQFFTSRQELSHCMDQAVFLQDFVKKNNFGQVLQYFMPQIESQGLLWKTFTSNYPTSDEMALLDTLLIYKSTLFKLNYFALLIYNQFKGTHGPNMTLSRAPTSVIHSVQTFSNPDSSPKLSRQIACNDEAVALLNFVILLVRANILLTHASRDKGLLCVALNQKLSLLRLCQMWANGEIQDSFELGPGSVLHGLVTDQVGRLLEACAKEQILIDPASVAFLTQCPICGLNDTKFSAFAMFQCANQHQIERCPYSFIPVVSFPTFKCLMCSSYARTEIYDPSNPYLAYIEGNLDIMQLEANSTTGVHLLWPYCPKCEGRYQLIEEENMTI